MSGCSSLPAPGCLVLGVDIGSVSVALVAVEAGGGQVVHEQYALHHGDVRGTLGKLAEAVSFTRVSAVAATASCARIVRAMRFYAGTVAGIRAARELHGELDALLARG